MSSLFALSQRFKTASKSAPSSFKTSTKTAEGKASDIAGQHLDKELEDELFGCDNDSQTVDRELEEGLFGYDDDSQGECAEDFSVKNTAPRESQEDDGEDEDSGLEAAIHAAEEELEEEQHNTPMVSLPGLPGRNDPGNAMNVLPPLPETLETSPKAVHVVGSAGPVKRKGDTQESEEPQKKNKRDDEDTSVKVMGELVRRDYPSRHRLIRNNTDGSLDKRYKRTYWLPEKLEKLEKPPKTHPWAQLVVLNGDYKGLALYGHGQASKRQMHNGRKRTWQEIWEAVCSQVKTQQKMFKNPNLYSDMEFLRGTGRNKEDFMADPPSYLFAEA